ncbi:MAG: chemotaxis protein CheA [Deltaproteobacteria bacterium]|nr:chemotaxis protein CheA [Deltaproteobacteria bacterium]
MSVESQNQQAFRDEATELLGELENSLLELEHNPEDQELINRVFRAMHTIKGSGAMFGFEDIATFTHEVESVFELVRNKLVPISKRLLDLTLMARDQILAMLQGEDSGSGDQTQTVITGLKEIVRLHAPEQEKTAVEEKTIPRAGEIGDEGTNVFRIRFKPDRRIFLTGSNPYGLILDLADLGHESHVLLTEEVPLLQELDPESCYLSWDILLSTPQNEDAVREIFVFVEEDCDLQISTLMTTGSDIDDSAHKRLGEILIDRGDLTEDQLRQVLGQQKPLGALLAEQGLVPPAKVRSALKEQEQLRQKQTVVQQQKLDQGSSIRVPAEKLDSLVDLVGELVTVQARLSQFATQFTDTALVSIAEDLERLSDELRDSTLGVRMLPIGTTFNKFKRLVRDLSNDLGKEIELVTHGAETELDKTVIERLNDPLVHLLRNSIDHGIELPDERQAADKPRTGTIVLTAEHSGGEVLIQITDDGAGIDPTKLRAKAVERGIILPEADLTEQEMLGLIFAPGFSTAVKVTNVSGRGVGMDVVKRNIDALRGRIHVESQIGRGTTISIRLPLTLAIIDGLQVRVGSEFFILPLTLVEECVELVNQNDQDEKKRFLNLRGEIVPYIRLRNCFGISGRRPPIEQVVITTTEDQRMGIVVDTVVGEHQTVIKSLGRVYRDVKGLSGATVKGDGTLALILDIPGLVQSVQPDKGSMQKHV